jgi:hypothetical protein
MSKRLATISATPAEKNQPMPKRTPHPTFKATPITVKMLGLMWPRASQRTMASMIL